jgi:DNA-directed RNA polymerase subunit RPC12/RpoP
MAKKKTSSSARGSAVPARPVASWKCPRCGRAFTQVNQRHACGTGNSKVVLRDRPEALARIYASIEAFAQTLGPIEIVARERYVLLRSVRIFADLVIMTDAVRIAVHLRRRVADPQFFKVVGDAKKVTHVAKLQTAADVNAIKPYLKEAYAASLE